MNCRDIAQMESPISPREINKLRVLFLQSRRDKMFIEPGMPEHHFAPAERDIRLAGRAHYAPLELTRYCLLIFYRHLAARRPGPHSQFGKQAVQMQALLGLILLWTTGTTHYCAVSKSWLRTDSQPIAERGSE
jgi:hypothetical protein